MIRPIDIKLNAAHPELPLVEATTFTGAPSSVFIRGVPKSCGNWSITAINVAVTYPDNSTTTRAAVESAEGVWVATIPGTATSGRTAAGFKIMADGIDENGAAVTGYVLGFADFSVLSFTPVPAPGGTFYLLRYFDQAPATPKEGDVAKIDGLYCIYNGTAWDSFGDGPGFSTDNPQMDGTASPGSAVTAARSDHVHPTDTSRMAANATGADIAVSGTDSTKINAALSGKLDKSGGMMTPTFASTAIPSGKVVFGTDAAGPYIGIAYGQNVVMLRPSEVVLNDRNVALTAGTGHAGNLAALDANGNPTDSTIPAANVATKGNIPYSLGTPTVISTASSETVEGETVNYGAATLANRTANIVQVTAATALDELRITFPAPTKGKVRDFGLRVEIGTGSAALTAPALVPIGSPGEIVKIENNAAEIPALADGTATAKGVSFLYFSETAPGVFVVKGEQVEEVA